MYVYCTHVNVMYIIILYICSIGDSLVKVINLGNLGMIYRGICEWHVVITSQSVCCMHLYHMLRVVQNSKT